MVRGTTRDPSRSDELEAAGVEPVIADPDRVATLVPAFSQVTVACVLLASAVGDPDRIAALHTTRLEMLLSKLLDTTARGIVYEAAGTVPREVLGRGARLVQCVCERSRIPYVLVEADPGDVRTWTEQAAGAVQSVLSP